MMHHPTQRASLAVMLLVALSACAPTRVSGRLPSGDAAIFVAVIEGAKERWSGGQLEVDLQPLADDPDGKRLRPLDAADLPSFVATRHESLRGFPWREVTGARSSPCPGRLPGADTSGCPSALTYRYSVGVYREGGAAIRGGPVDSALRTVRVVEATLDRTGATWETYDAVLASRGNSRWTVIARHSLDFIP